MVTEFVVGNYYTLDLGDQSLESTSKDFKMFFNLEDRIWNKKNKCISAIKLNVFWRVVFEGQRESYDCYNSMMMKYSLVKPNISSIFYQEDMEV